MKASALISRLELLIKEHGDLDVYYRDTLGNKSVFKQHEGEISSARVRDYDVLVPDIELRSESIK